MKGFRLQNTGIYYWIAEEKHRSRECLVENERESQANGLDENYYKFSVMNAAKNLAIVVRQLTRKTANPIPT